MRNPHSAPNTADANTSTGAYESTAPPAVIYAAASCPALCESAHRTDIPMKLSPRLCFFSTARVRRDSAEPKMEKRSDVTFPNSRNEMRIRQNDTAAASVTE